MHNPSGAVPEFISLQPAAEDVKEHEENFAKPSAAAAKGQQHRNNSRSSGLSSRGHYGPPKTPRGGLIRSQSDQVRSKRKREATSGDRVQDQGGLSEVVFTNGAAEAVTNGDFAEDLMVLEWMPWHPSCLRRYSNGIVGYVTAHDPTKF